MRVSPDIIPVNQRFFQAIDALVKKRELRGLQTFTRLHHLNYWNVSTLRKEPDKHILKPEYILYLVSCHNVNANWLFTGKGEMFNPAPRKD